MESQLRSTEQTLFVKVPWNPFAARGFAVSCVAVVLLILLLSLLDITPIPYHRSEIILPDSAITLIFGTGDGTGRRKGNLSPEGIKKTGMATPDALDDAANAMKSRVIVKSPPASDPMTTSKLQPKKDISAEHNGADSLSNSTRNIGDATSAKPGGTGLGWTGTGTGKGEGWGDIDWGGGGNRVVLTKKKPPFPPGAQPAVIRIQFRVRPDGTVGRMVPLQKADPRLEQAAMEALRLWKFNPVPGASEMTGVIPFQFTLN